MITDQPHTENITCDTVVRNALIDCEPEPKCVIIIVDVMCGGRDIVGPLVWLLSQAMVKNNNPSDVEKQCQSKSESVYRHRSFSLSTHCPTTTISGSYPTDPCTA